METTINTEEFKNALVLASVFCLSKTASIPSLHGGQLKFENKAITITSSNLNNTYRTKVIKTGPLTGNFVVDIKKIAALLSLVKTKEIVIKEEKNKLFLNIGGTKAEFSSLSVSDFPEPPEEEGEKKEMGKDFFKTLLPAVVFAASRDETRPVLTGIRFDTYAGSPCVVATDGFRLGMVCGEGVPGVGSLTISSQALSFLSRLPQTEKQKAFYMKKNKTLLVKNNSHEVYTRIIDGDYPAFEKVIPSTYKTRAEFSKQEVEAAVKTASIFAQEETSTVVFVFEKERIKIFPRSKASDTATIEVVPKKTSGESLTIAFNQRFLLDLFNNTASETLVFEGNDSTSPGVFKREEDPRFLHVIMPVRIQA